MPVYVYRTLPEDGSPSERFEVVHAMDAPPLTHHPETGVPVKRIITAVGVLRKHSSSAERNLLSDENVGRHGFTRYRKVGSGEYQRTAGTQGPDRIVRGED